MEKIKQLYSEMAFKNPFLTKVINFFSIENMVLGTFDLHNPHDSIYAFVKMRCNLEEKDTVTWWQGTILAVLPDNVPQALFKFEGFNNARMVRQPDGSYQMLSREVSFYQDIKSNDIIEDWLNPFTGKENAVVQVQNDPVNHAFGKPNAKHPFVLPWVVIGDDVFLSMDIPLSYPNPLPPDLYPEESNHKTYYSSEHFSFYCKLSDLKNRKIKQAPTYFSWTRLSPYLPWMKMGDRPGNLLYVARGVKLQNGIKDLPPHIVSYTNQNYPQFLEAPRHWTQPNETSWTFYKKLVEKNPAFSKQAHQP